MTKYIRLSDYFVIDTLVSLAKSRTEELLSEIENATDAVVNPGEMADFEQETEGGLSDKNKKSALFSIDMALASTSFTFTPELQDFQSGVESAIYAAVKTIMTPERLIEDDELKQYTQVNVDDGGEDQNGEVEVC